MKNKIRIVLAAAFLGLQASSVGAATATFNMSVTIPDPPGGISITVSQVNASTNAFTTLPGGTTALSFDPLTFNASTNIYLPSVYYAVDFGVTGTSGSPDVTITYSEGSNPNGASNGFGYKATATFAKETTNTNGSTSETLLTAHGPKKRLIDLSGEHVAYTELSGGWLRMYLGIWTGSTASPADPSNGQPFSNSDAPGTYTGSIFITSVVN